jgi:hypothetical protein
MDENNGDGDGRGRPMVGMVMVVVTYQRHGPDCVSKKPITLNRNDRKAFPGHPRYKIFPNIESSVCFLGPNASDHKNIEQLQWFEQHLQPQPRALNPAPWKQQLLERRLSGRSCSEFNKKRWRP